MDYSTTSSRARLKLTAMLQVAPSEIVKRTEVLLKQERGPARTRRLQSFDAVREFGARSLPLRANPPAAGPSGIASPLARSGACGAPLPDRVGAERCKRHVVTCQGHVGAQATGLV